MKKTFLVVGIACATMMAVAQSNAPQDKSAQGTGATNQREVASGMPSGKRMHKPITITKDRDVSSPGVMVRESPSKASLGRTSVAADTQANSTSGTSDAQVGVKVRESPSKASLGKTSVAVDEQAKTKNSMSNAQSNPMYKDNGNTSVNPLYQGSDRNATKTRSNIQNNRVATGDVDGDGMADRAIVKSKSNITNNRVAAGDVNGDGTPDAAVSPTPAPAQMKGDFSRGHQPDRKAAGAASSNTSREAQSGLATGKRQHN